MTVYVVQIIPPHPDAPWVIAGVFDERAHADDLVSWMEEQSRLRGCLIGVLELERNVAYI